MPSHLGDTVSCGRQSCDPAFGPCVTLGGWGTFGEQKDTAPSAGGGLRADPDPGGLFAPLAQTVTASPQMQELLVFHAPPRLPGPTRCAV